MLVQKSIWKDTISLYILYFEIMAQYILKEVCVKDCLEKEGEMISQHYIAVTIPHQYIIVNFYENILQK